MRRSIIFLISALLALSLAGCASPAETTAPDNRETQTETAVVSSSEETLPSGAETEGSEVPGTETTETETPDTEESTDVSVPEESENSSEETSPEETAGESSEEPPVSSDEAGSECILLDTFRFTASESWEKQDDGSFTAADGSVRISFCTVPLSDEVFSEGIGFRDEDLGSELAAYFSGISEDGVSYAVYDSPSADMFSRTDSGLEYRFLLLRTAENGGYTGTSILSAYEISEENLLVIRFRYAFDSGIAAEQCLEAVNHTIERLP